MMTLEERCKLATDCLPVAEYRTRLEDLHAELLALRKDAERYRKLRRGQRWSVIDGIGNTLRGEALDASVDAAPALPANTDDQGRR
jgi:hypothetical protein